MSAASRGNGAPQAFRPKGDTKAGTKAGSAASAADAEKKPRRVILISRFPEFCGTIRNQEQPANFAA
jgi:hypothetical protein